MFVFTWRHVLRLQRAHENELMRKLRIKWGLESPSRYFDAVPEMEMRRRVELLRDDRPMFWTLMIQDGLVCC